MSIRGVQAANRFNQRHLAPCRCDHARMRTRASCLLSTWTAESYSLDRVSGIFSAACSSKKKSGDRRMSMRKYALSGALAGAVIATVTVLPNRADAMTFSTLSDVLDAGASIDVAQPDRVRWCGSQGCWARYRYYDYYRPWPYYYQGWPRCLQAAISRCG